MLIRLVDKTCLSGCHTHLLKHVLSRVLTQSDFMEAMGMYYSGWIAKNTPENSSVVPAEIPHFLAKNSLIPYINKHLGHLQNVVLKYRTEKGSLNLDEADR